MTPIFNAAAVPRSVAERVEIAKQDRSRAIADVKRGNSVAANKIYVSEKALADGWKPPHSEGSALRTFTTADTIKFVRFHVDKDKPQGAFLIRAKEIEHLNGDPEKIKKYLGLKEVPSFISDVEVPPNTAMEVSVIGAQPNFGLDRTSGFQYILKDEIPDGSYKNTRPLR